MGNLPGLWLYHQQWQKMFDVSAERHSQSKHEYDYQSFLKPFLSTYPLLVAKISGPR